ncbi:probable porin protein [Aquitalea magnusonii]|uniref:Probable porin protein n=1 Tax=Aquitalea magnusonii TaxID=332411 RepID=A0A3G9GEQ6_9NEIS|nr:porin [Aquitalea magnusonii]BBF84731.1 probable porin protein [Aquitalea magnusonii]
MMHKKSLAALVATLFAVPFAAHADVTIYGFLSSSIESTKATGASANTAGDYKSRTRVVDDNSRIGFKGNEDLGNGTKAIWQVESSLKYFEQGGTNDKGETATFATRNSFVGLDNGTFGKVLLGQNDTAYKTLTNIGLNLFGDTTAENNGSSQVYSRAETRLKNSIHYFSPNWSGFQFGLSYGVDETRALDVNSAQTNASRISLAANYTNGGLQVAAGWDRQNDKALSSANSSSNVSGKNTTFYKLATSYKFATGTFVGAGYEFGRFDSNNSGNTLKQDDWTLSVGQDIGAATLKLEYSSLGRLKGAAAGTEGDYKAHQWALGADYNLSKTTKVFSYYTKITNKASQNANFANTPIYTSNVGNSGASLSKGVDPQAFGVGLKVAF